MVQTSLLANNAQLTPEDARDVHFDRAVLGGYNTQQVDRFLTRMAGTLESLYAALDDRATEQHELVEEIDRLSGRAASRVPDPEPAGREALAILRAAQDHADSIVAEAKQEAERVVLLAKRHHDQVIEHVHQQADGIIADARRTADEEYRRVVGEAPAEAQRRVDFFTRLAGTITDTLNGNVQAMLSQLAEWDRLARSGGGEPGAEAAPAT